VSDDPSSKEFTGRLYADFVDSLDEELELALDDDRLSPDSPAHEAEGELVTLQDWAVQQGLTVGVLFEGRDGECEVSISDEEQHWRFTMRIQDPLTQGKLSPMDLESRRRWEQYTKAKEVMLERTPIPEAHWWIVEADDKRRARLNCIHHLLGQIPYEELPHDPVVLPARVHQPEHSRRPVRGETFRCRRCIRTRTPGEPLRVKFTRSGSPGVLVTPAVSRTPGSI
jgi:hypothetical protein